MKIAEGDFSRNGIIRMCGKFLLAPHTKMDVEKIKEIRKTLQRLNEEDEKWRKEWPYFRYTVGYKHG